MTRATDWQKNIDDAVRKEVWVLSGANRAVKVVPAGDVRTHGSGYITVGKYLLNKTPQQIESALGLPKGYLARGAWIYKLLRVPQPSEYTYELTTEFPDGLAYNPAYSNPNYPPGSRAIHQWKIRDTARIPVDLAHFDLRPGAVLPYFWLLS